GKRSAKRTASFFVTFVPRAPCWRSRRWFLRRCSWKLKRMRLCKSSCTRTGSRKLSHQLERRYCLGQTEMRKWQATGRPSLNAGMNFHVDVTATSDGETPRGGWVDLTFPA